jgi:hypothetical protein
VRIWHTQTPWQPRNFIRIRTSSEQRAHRGKIAAISRREQAPPLR